MQLALPCGLPSAAEARTAAAAAGGRRGPGTCLQGNYISQQASRGQDCSREARWETCLETNVLSGTLCWPINTQGIGKSALLRLRVEVPQGWPLPRPVLACSSLARPFPAPAPGSASPQEAPEPRQVGRLPSAPLSPSPRSPPSPTVNMADETRRLSRDSSPRPTWRTQLQPVPGAPPRLSPALETLARFWFRL